MTTIATDGKSMAGDGQSEDHCRTIVSHTSVKVSKLGDGRILGAAGNSLDADAWQEWVSTGKVGACPIESDQFAGLILNTDGTVLWVDHKGREILTPTPVAIGSGQDFAYGAMEAGASPCMAVQIAAKRDPGTGGIVTIQHLEPEE